MKILIYQIRTELGYSLNELSRLSGISSSQIQRIESELQSPTLYTLEKISKALKCNIKDLFVE